MTEQTYESYMQADADQLRTINKYLDRLGREQCAKIALVWYRIKQSDAWYAWGYACFADAVSEEAPRGLSTINELIANYDHFVASGHLHYEEFAQLLRDHGLKRVTLLRIQTKTPLREKKPEIAQSRTDKSQEVQHRTGCNTPEQLPLPSEEQPGTAATLFKDTLKTAVEEIGPLTIAEAKKKGPHTNGTSHTQDFISRHYSFTPEQDRNIQDAINHLRTRIRGEYQPNESTALAYVAAEYLAAYGNRRVIH